MKTKLLLISLTLFLSCNCISQNNDYSFKESYRIGQPAHLTVSSSDGNIDVVGSETDQIEVLFIAKQKGKVLTISKEELREEGINLDVFKKGNYLEISVGYPFNYYLFNLFRPIHVDFEIKVPKETYCHLKASDGNIQLSNLEMDQECRTSDGNIKVTTIKGNLETKSSDGNIQISSIKGNVSIRCSDGNIQVNLVKGNLVAGVSDGRIELNDIKGSVQLQSSDGSVTLNKIMGDVQGKASDGRITISDSEGFISLRTSDGGINVNNSNGTFTLKSSDGSISFSDLRGSLNAKTSDGSVKGNITELRDHLNIKTSDGRIDIAIPEGLGLDLNISGNSKEAPLDNFSGSAEKRSIVGTVNGGGIPVNLSASDGKIILNYR